MSRYVACLFDLDGTLIDLNPEAAELEQLRNDVVHSATRGGVVVKSRSVFKVYQQVLIQCGFDSSTARAIRESLDGYETKWAQSRVVVKGGNECVQELKRNGYMAGIVTSNGRALLRVLFELGKLRSGWFDVTIARDDVSLLKPSSVPLQCAYQLLRKQSSEISKIWFVGDSDNDIGAANEFRRCAPVDFNFAQISSVSMLDHGFKSYPSINSFLKAVLETKC
jgi:phosphoglycolate phosphatase-like HAD superfamily hydrolase